MTKNDYEYKNFLIEQLQWSKQQDSILEVIEIKLHVMKRIAEYAAEHELTRIESNRLNVQLGELKSEIQSLEMLLHTSFH